jgi:hypothetical protein
MREILPQNLKRDTLACGRGVGGSQSERLEKKPSTLSSLCHTPAKRPTQVVTILEGSVVGVDGVHLLVRESVPPCPVPEDAQHLVHDGEALVGQLTIRQVRTLVQAFQQAAARSKRLSFFFLYFWYIFRDFLQ